MANELSDRRRLAALRGTGILEEPPSEALDRLTRLATRVLGVPVSVVSLIDDSRQYYAANTGIGEPWKTMGGSPLSHSFCKHVVATGEALIVEDARTIDYLKDNGATVEMGVVAYAGLPLDVDGQVIGTFCAVETSPRRWSPSDIEALETLREAAVAEIQLRSANKQLSSALDRQEELIGVVSHELRSPLTSINAALKLMEAKPSENAQTRQLAAMASRGTDRLIRLVDDLLDIERAESGQLKLDKRCVAIGELFEDAREATSGVADEAGVKVEFAPTDESIDADADRIVQVIVNLVGNAVKFSPRGGTVSVSAARTDGHVRIAVSDQGRGIPADKLESIFERFVQVALEDGTSKKGAGLGLAISKAIIEQHGGRIWAENNSGTGAVFQFEVPLTERR